MLPARALALLILFGGCATAPAPATVSSPEPHVDAETFRVLLQEMVDARWATTDAAAAQGRSIAERTLDESYLQVFENGDTLTAAKVIESRTPERLGGMRQEMRATNASATVRDVHAIVRGDTAVVSYIVEMRITFNATEVKKSFRATDTLMRKSGAWKSLLHTEVVMPAELSPAAVDTASYADYVGRYRLTPSIVYEVTMSDGRLYWGKGGRRELVPESESTFGFRRLPERNVDLNTSYRITFFRGREGKVTHLRMTEFPGVAYDALRID